MAGLRDVPVVSEPPNVFAPPASSDGAGGWRGAGWPAGPSGTAGFDGEPRRRRLSDGRVLAAVALVLSLIASLLCLFGVSLLFFLVGGVFFVVAAPFVIASVAAGVAAVVTSIRDRRPGRRGRLLVVALFLVPAVAAYAVTVDTIFFARDREAADDRARAQKLARPLPATATPAQVVEYAYLAEAGLDGASATEIRRERVCAVRVPRLRGRCTAFAPDLYSPGKKPRFAIRLGPRLAIVTWTSNGPFAEPRAVRLERGPRGWELIDVPASDLGFGGCVEAALARGTDPWSCPQQPD